MSETAVNLQIGGPPAFFKTGMPHWAKLSFGEPAHTIAADGRSLNAETNQPAGGP